MYRGRRFGGAVPRPTPLVSDPAATPATLWPASRAAGSAASPRARKSARSRVPAGSPWHIVSIIGPMTRNVDKLNCITHGLSAALRGAIQLAHAVRWNCVMVGSQAAQRVSLPQL